MKLRKALFGIGGITLGSIGVLTCIAAIALLWVVSVRIERRAEGLFEKMDGSLAVIRRRVLGLHQRVAEAAITAGELEKSLRAWTRESATAQLAARIEDSERVRRLASTLEETEHWLEISESSLKVIQEIVALRNEAASATDSDSVDRLLEEVATLRTQFAEITKFVANIHESITKTGDDKTLADRLRQIERLAVLIVAKVTSVSEHLDRLADRLSEAQVRVQELKSETRSWFLIGTTGVSLLLAWMSAGQVALCVLAWNWRR
jgi:hypothetical protein